MLNAPKVEVERIVVRPEQRSAQTVHRPGREQLYEQFVASSPALGERVPQQDLAGYIGVPRVGLNRIMKRCRMRQ
jgi:hypothetical protein